jgi:hypothetical protein
MGKCSNAFFSEIPNQTESKLDRNVHWMVLYIVYVFCSNIKWKMAATAGLSLTIPMIIPVQFGLYCPCGFREEAF